MFCKYRQVNNTRTCCSPNNILMPGPHYGLCCVWCQKTAGGEGARRTSATPEQMACGGAPEVHPAVQSSVRYGRGKSCLAGILTLQHFASLHLHFLSHSAVLYYSNALQLYRTLTFAHYSVMHCNIHALLHYDAASQYQITTTQPHYIALPDSVTPPHTILLHHSWC